MKAGWPVVLSADDGDRIQSWSQGMGLVWGLLSWKCGCRTAEQTWSACSWRGSRSSATFLSLYVLKASLDLKFRFCWWVWVTETARVPSLNLVVWQHSPCRIMVLSERRCCCFDVLFQLHLHPRTVRISRSFNSKGWFLSISGWKGDSSRKAVSEPRVLTIYTTEPSGVPVSNRLESSASSLLSWTL